MVVRKSWAPWFAERVENGPLETVTIFQAPPLRPEEIQRISEIVARDFGRLMNT